MAYYWPTFLFHCSITFPFISIKTCDFSQQILLREIFRLFVCYISKLNDLDTSKQWPTDNFLKFYMLVDLWSKRVLGENDVLVHTSLFTSALVRTVCKTKYSTEPLFQCIVGYYKRPSEYSIKKSWLCRSEVYSKTIKG